MDGRGVGSTWPIRSEGELFGRTNSAITSRSIKNKVKVIKLPKNTQIYLNDATSYIRSSALEDLRTGEIKLEGENDSSCLFGAICRMIECRRSSECLRESYGDMDAWFTGTTRCLKGVNGGKYTVFSCGA